jgi:glycosyltransferase involved in cell wall biosynthesis
MIVENLPCPFDRRVMQEARTLASAGYTVSIICPKAPGYEKSFERVDDIDIHRHSLPREADGFAGYLLEYSVALLMEFWLSLKVLFGRGFDIIHACNPPDTIFLIGGFYKLFGKQFVFDHHDINPELYEAKFGKRGFGRKLLVALERMTFNTADVVISTNESYREIALTRGGVDPDNVFVVRSGPDLTRLKRVPPNPALKKGRKYLVGYVGVMGKQEGIDLLLQAVQLIVHYLKRTDIQFGLVGGGTELEAMRQLAKDLDVAEYVTFTGRVPDAELLEMLNTADICVNPDRANDMNDRSTMNKVMEYMALGKPLVQFDLTEGRVSAGEASWYARPNDVADLAQKMVSLLAEEGQRQYMSQVGRNRIEHVLS